jgi:hypothetical protein
MTAFSDWKIASFQQLTPPWGMGILGALVAGWSSLVARRAHNPKVAGSNPAPAISKKRRHQAAFATFGGPHRVPRPGSFWDVEPGRRVLESAQSGGESSPVAARRATLPNSARGPAGSGGFLFGQVAQLVEHATENRGVGGSTPPLATGQVEGGPQLIGRSVAQLVEHRSPKPGVGGSIPSGPVWGSRQVVAPIV